MDSGGVVLLAAFGLVLVSFWPSARGHWSGLLLAVPSVVLGFLIAVAIANEGGRVYPGIIPACVLYFGLGVASILLWISRRGRRLKS